MNGAVPQDSTRPSRPGTAVTETTTKLCYIGFQIMNRPRILIADDHNLVAELCKRLLEIEFDVVGTVSDGRALVRAAGELKPDVVVVDVAMPVLNGLDAGRQVKAPPSAGFLRVLRANSARSRHLGAFVFEHAWA